MFLCAVALSTRFLFTVTTSCCVAMPGDICIPWGTFLSRTKQPRAFLHDTLRGYNFLYLGSGAPGRRTEARSRRREAARDPTRDPGARPSHRILPPPIDEGRFALFSPHHPVLPPNLENLSFSSVYTEKPHDGFSLHVPERDVRRVPICSF